MSLKDDPRIIKGIARLRAMGFKVVFDELEEDKWGVLVIDIVSVINYIKRRLDESVKYPNMFVFIDWDSKIIEIHVWRGSTPEKVKELMIIAREKEELLKEYQKIKSEIKSETK